MSHRGDRYGKKYILCNFFYRLSFQPWVSRCARGTVPWVHRDTGLGNLAENTARFHFHINM